MNVIVDVRTCPSCKKDHGTWLFYPLNEPVFIDGYPYKHVSRCPNTKDLIFVRSENIFAFKPVTSDPDVKHQQLRIFHNG